MMLVLLVSACSDPAAPMAYQRLDLDPVPGAPPWPRLEHVDELGFPDGWVTDAQAAAESPTGLWRVFDPTGNRLLSVKHRAEFDLAAFDSIMVSLSAAGPGQVWVELWDGAELVGVTRRESVIVSDDLVRVHLPAALLWRSERRADRLVLKAAASVQRLDLASLTLSRQPAGAGLPDPSGPPQLLALWDDARSAEGLDGARELSTRAVVPTSGQLSFAHIWEPWRGPGGSAPQLVVEVSAGETLVVRRFARPDDVLLATRWSDEQIDLAELAGREAEVRLRLERGDGPPVACAIGELALWSPVASPSTVVFITSDTHRADHLAAAPGSVEVTTPVLDALAARGVLFSDCLATTNVTNPSHIALLSGLHPAQTGILHNSQPLGERASTLAEAFAAAGWRTAAVVSTRHLGNPTSGLGQGFDRMSWPATGGRRPVEQTIPLAEGALDAAGGRPLFLWVHLFDAHTPYEPPARWKRHYWPEDQDPFDPEAPEPGVPSTVLPPSLAGLRDFDYPAAVYRGEVSRLDEGLSSLLARDRVARGVVAMTADHGESFGQHGIWFTHSGLYPDTIHVPLVLAFPGAPAGTVVDAPVGHLDLAATILDLAAVDRAGVPGLSFGDLARGARAPAAPRFAVAAHGYSASVTHDGWHLLLQLLDESSTQMTSSFDMHQVQLYDLRTDRACEDDLWERELPRARALRTRLVAWLTNQEDLGLAGEVVQDAERFAQLRALGYLEQPSARRSELWVPDDCAWCARFNAAGGR